MKVVDAYQTSDGKLFTNEDKAKSHQDDIIGEALDSLVADIGGNITRVDRHRTLLATMDDKDLIEKVTILYNALSFNDE